MITVTIDVCEAKDFLTRAGSEGRHHLLGLGSWARDIVRQGLEALLNAELEVLLERERAEGTEEPRNWRNGYRRRTLSILGLGRLAFRVPRDRKGHYRSEMIPFRKRRTTALEEMAAEMFLAGLSTRDVGRVLERHFGDRFDSKEISRMVAATSGELDAWRARSLAGTRYRFLYLDGTNFKVRRGDIVERLPVLVVIGAREDTDRLEVLAVEMGEREHTESWEGVFADLARRGLELEGVELGVMDGLPGLEAAFSRWFPCGKPQRCQVHAKRNAFRRVAKRDRDAFRSDLDRVFYNTGEAAGRRAFVQLKKRWGTAYSGAVGVIERDLDSLLRFYQFPDPYWPSLRTTNPIERLNKEFKRRTKAMEITGGEVATYRLLAYVALTMNMGWRKYVLSSPRHFYTLKAA